METGVKETKEALVGLLVASVLLAKHFKDGVQGKDFPAIYTEIMANEELKAKLLVAYEGYNKVPEEVKDLKAAEVVELLTAALPEVLKLIEEFRS